MGQAVSATLCEEAAVETPLEVQEDEVAEEEVAVEEHAEAEDAEETAEEPKREIVLETAPIDYRFPTTNQAANCFVKYNEAHKCFADNGADSPECARKARNYRSICPTEWLDKWNEARDAGAWWGKY